MTPTLFSTCAEIVVTGHNPENADYDNPRGEIYGYAGYVVAEAENGERRRLHVTTAYFAGDALDAAQKVADALNVRLHRLGKLPVAFDRWEHWHAAYGSDAHDEADLIAWERRLDEEEQY